MVAAPRELVSLNMGVVATCSALVAPIVGVLPAAEVEPAAIIGVVATSGEVVPAEKIGVVAMRGEVVEAEKVGVVPAAAVCP